MVNKKLYCLQILKQLYEDWVGGIWLSKLYATEEACKHGCLIDEIFDIAQRVTLFDDSGELHDSADQLRSAYLKNDEAVHELIGNIEEWLRAPKGESLNEEDPQPLLWEILELNLADGLTLTTK